MADSDEVAYDGALPGPWLCIDDNGRTIDDVTARQATYGRVRCAICREEWGRLPAVDWREYQAAARRHWEAHVLPIGSTFTMFDLPGAGCTKYEFRGTWADVFLYHRSIYINGGRSQPTPSYEAALDMASKGSSHAGMGGGLEWPRGIYNRSDHEAVTRALVEAGHPPLTAPEWVVSEETYEVWAYALAFDCSFDHARQQLGH